MYGLNEKEVKILKALNTPRKIQDFLNKIPINFEEKGDTCFSPRKVLRENKAHCMEGAMLVCRIENKWRKAFSHRPYVNTGRF